MRIFRGILFASIFLILTPARGSDQKICLQSLKPRLPALTLNSEITIRSGEKASSGRLLARGEKFPDLGDGAHVFIVDQDQNLVYSHRYPDLNQNEPLVTHRSLYQFLKNSTGKEPVLIALGEIHVDNGVISSINNKAGTAFLSNEYLPELAALLKERGLPLTPETPVVPFNEVRTGHDSELEAAAFRLQVESDPLLKALNEKLLKLRRDAQPRFPKAGAPGMVDWSAFFMSDSGPLDRITLKTIKSTEYQLLGALSWMESMNDRYRILPILSTRMTLDELQHLMDHLYRLEGALR